MKKIISVLFILGLCSGSASAMGPRFFCKSEDGKKTVRTAEGPWSLVAKIYHDEVVYQVLNCEQNTPEYLLYCSDDHNERSFRIKYDERTGYYGGKWNSRRLNCEKINDMAE